MRAVPSIASRAGPGGTASSLMPASDFDCARASAGDGVGELDLALQRPVGGEGAKRKSGARRRAWQGVA